MLFFTMQNTQREKNGNKTGLTFVLLVVVLIICGQRPTPFVTAYAPKLYTSVGCTCFWG